MKELWDHQKRIKKKTYELMRSGMKHLLVCAPTGAGKTVLFSSIINDFVNNNKKILVLTDREELLIQANDSSGNKSFLIQAGCKSIPNYYNCFIGMAQTLRNRVGKNELFDEFIKSLDLILIDECHEQTFNFIFESGLVNDKWVLGFTATPKRSGKMRQLGLDYQTIINETNVKELIYLSILVKDDYYPVANVDASRVKIDKLTGDYSRKDLFKKFDTRKLYSGIVKNYNAICPNSKAIVFCVNKEHAIKTAIEFYEANIPVKFILSGSTKPKELLETANESQQIMFDESLNSYNLYMKWFNKLSGDRKEVFNWFKNTKSCVLVNVDIATKGFDCRDIETVILNLKTTSITRLLQAIGRGARSIDCKTHFNILDFGNNCIELGYYSENRNWSLWHDEKNGNGVVPVKECGFNNKGIPIKSNKDGCRQFIPVSSTICPICGFKYPHKVQQQIVLELMSYDPNSKMELKFKKPKEMSVNELIEYSKINNHKQAWIWRQLFYRGGSDYIRKIGLELHWSPKIIESAVNFTKNM